MICLLTTSAVVSPVAEPADVDSGKEIYNAEIVKRVIQYITQKQIRLYNLQSEIVDIDTWHELWRRFPN